MSVGDDGYDGGRCSCGCAWFKLEAVPDKGMPEGVFTVDQDGHVTGYMGKPVCKECGEPWTPPRQRLRIV